MRLLDSNSARRRALKFLFFLGWFAGARVSLPKDAFLTRPWPISRLRQRSEQNRCCRARRGTERLQPAQITGASRLLANAFVIANSSFQNRGNKLVVADIGKRAIDHEFLRQRAGNQTGKLNGVARAQYLDDRRPVLFPFTLKVSEEPGVELLRTPAGAAATNAVSGLEQSAQGKNSTPRVFGADLLA
jgi:hypothetical protein